MDFNTPQGRLDSLHAALVKSDLPVAIVVHNYPDPDCIASALAMQELLKVWHIGSMIIYGGGIGRPENKAMIGLLEIELHDAHYVYGEECRGAVLVDSQPDSGNVIMPKDVDVVAVIDHHPAHEDVVQSVKVVDIRTDFGATSSIMLEYLEAAGVRIDSRLATALYLGIKTDTDSLERNACEIDIQSYVKLLPLVDLGIVTKVSHPPLSDEYFFMLDAALQDASRFGEAIVANLGLIPIPDLLSSVSDMMVQAKGVAWALAVGWLDRRVYFSLRIKPPRKNAASIMQKTVSELGTGGGHAMAAGGQVVADEDEDCTSLADKCVLNFLDAVGMSDQHPRQIVPDSLSCKRPFSIDPSGDASDE